MKVLIVEDDPTTRYFLEAILQEQTHEVMACKDAETALQFYECDHYPLVVLDWVLPGMDGLELCRKMRRLPEGDRSFILVTTKRDQAEDLQAVLEAGADDYLAKPFDLDLLKVRLTIAGRQAKHLAERKDAEAKLSKIYKEIEKNRDDMRSILNQMRIGTAMTDEAQQITFLSQVAQRLFNKREAEVKGKSWETLGCFEEKDKQQIQAMLKGDLVSRPKLSLRIETSKVRPYWVDVEIKDDPQNPSRKIFFFYDMSDVYDLRRQLDEKARFHDLVGKSRPMRLIYQQIQDVAVVDTTVLIEGETGTGKELVARAIHYSSHRKGFPFVAVNCAGFTDSLLLSQLFGHKRGAFTGAIEDHKGLFEAADQGTLFLDEIGDLSMNVQTALLRVLQEKEITRIGESKVRKIDVRVLAATHRDLNEAVTQGTFRSDLLYRIRVARIHLPPLRERREDIPLLISAFISKFRAATDRPVHDISHEAMGVLMDYYWPGNVRELQGTIEFAMIRCKDSIIQKKDLPPEVIESIEVKDIQESLEIDDEKQRILRALNFAKGNRTVAARLLGISRATFYRKLINLDISTEQLQQGHDS